MLHSLLFFSIRSNLDIYIVPMLKYLFLHWYLFL
nr:MAG TPA: hypothetical protein [Microviridae sp.]